MRGVRALVLTLLALSCSLAACSKKTPPPPPSPTSGATNAAGDPGDPPSIVATEVPDDPLYPKKHDLPPSEAPRDNIDIPTGTNFVPGAPAVPPVAAPVDPLASSIASARSGAVPCFAPLPPGDWSATMVITVTATGTVTRSEIEPGNVKDDAVITCLKSYAAGLSFGQSEGRTLRIEVHVKG
jgi:hypothetical protein